MPVALSPQQELRLRLLPRIGQYRARGWIDALEEAEYVQLLERSGYSDDRFARDEAAAQVKRSLDFVQRRQERARDGADGSDGAKGSAAGRDAADTDGDGGAFGLKISEKRGIKGTESGAEDDEGDEVRSPGSMSDEITVDQLRGLFVETCFFARLGFLQPPSCLRCAYRLAGKKDSDDDDNRRQCSRPVVWRRDANEPLHPDRMDGDSLAVATCRTAGAWTRGEDRGGLSWDRKSKRLVPAWGR